MEAARYAAEPEAADEIEDPHNRNRIDAARV